MAANNYQVNYDDERFSQVESDKKLAMSELEQTYGGMTGESDKYYQAQIDASKQWADKQTQLQQEQTDFAIEQIEQQKDQANKDYLKEQSGAYVDWQKQSNQYGANAEQRAAAGMTNTGYTESSQVSMYNTYQNRVATARESYNQAVLNYNNAIKDARLQNNANLAEIAYKALQTQLELSLQGFQYKNNLILEQANKKVELDNTYYSRYLDVLNQINRENEQAEAIRQYNQNYELSVKQYDESVRQFNEEYTLKKQEYQEGIRQFNEEIARLKAKDKQEYELDIKSLEQNKKKLEQDQKQWEAEMQLKKEQLAEEKRQFNEQMDYTRSKSSGGNSSSSDGTYILESAEEPELSLDPTEEPEPTPAPTPAPTYQPTNKIATYEDAKKQMQKSGVPSSAVAGLMTASAWNKLKKAFQKTGVGNEAVTNYGTYAMYVRDYVEGAIQYYKK